MNVDKEDLTSVNSYTFFTDSVNWPYVLSSKVYGIVN